VKCTGKDCNFEGVLATVSYMDQGWQFTSQPLCLLCRCRQREILHKRGIHKTKVVPCRD